MRMYVLAIVAAAALFSPFRRPPDGIVTLSK